MESDTDKDEEGERKDKEEGEKEEGEEDGAIVCLLDLKGLSRSLLRGFLGGPDVV